MKTNIAQLTQLLLKEEKKFAYYENKLRKYVSIQKSELAINVTESYKYNYEKVYKKLQKTLDKIIQIKTVIYEKNNQLKLTDGRTLQEATIQNEVLQKLKNYIESEISENDAEKVEKEYKKLEAEIQRTDSEISTLKAMKFENIM